MASAGETVAKITLQAKNEASPAINDVADSAKKAKEEVKDFGERAGAVGQGAGKLAGALGMISPAAADAAHSVADLADVGEVLASIGSPAGLAVVALGGLALASGAVVAGLGAAVMASDEALDALEGFSRIGSDFYPKVPKETLDSIEAVNASTDALTSIWDRAVVTLGANVAPAFEKVANVAVGLALVAEEMFEEFVTGRSILHDLSVFVVEQLVKALTTPLMPLQALAKGFLALSQAAGVDLPDGAEEAIQSFIDLQHNIAETAVTFYEGEGAGSALGDVYDELGAKGAKFIATQQRATAAVKGHAKATEEVKGAWTYLESQLDALNAGIAEINEAYTKGQAGAAAYADSQSVLDGVMGKVPTHLDAVNAKMMALFDAYTDNKISADAYTASLDLLILAQQRASELDAVAAHAATVKAGVDTGNSAISAVGSLSGLGGLDQSGMAGMVIAGFQTAAGIASSAGDLKAARAALDAATKSGNADDIAKAQTDLDNAQKGLESSNSLGQAKQMLDGLAEGMPALGEGIGDLVASVISDSVPALLDSLPDFLKGVMDSIPELMAAVIGAIPEMIASAFKIYYLMVPEALLEGLRVLTLPQTWIDIGKAFIDSLMEVFAPLFGKGKDGNKPGALMEGGWADSLFGGVDEKGYKKGLAAEGGFFDRLFGGVNDDPTKEWFKGSHAVGSDGVTQTGWHLVHQGERILSADGGSGSGRSMALLAQSGGDNHFHVNSIWPPTAAQMDMIFREFNRQIGANGRRQNLAGT